MMARRVYRSKRDIKIAGVCGGLGEHFDVDPTVFRVVFLLLAFYGGVGVLLYLIAWLLIPPGGAPASAAPGGPEAAGDRIESAARQAAEALDEKIRAWDPGSEKGMMVIGFLLVFIGLVLVLNNFNAFSFDLFEYVNWRKLWPSVLIAAGALLLWGQLRRT
ncbi:MAG TPA: PspC domain-containing protein [Candidatus Polarisedimenticolia bacterium]|nr:PspC domain-containing protein [Candidatus Polarisedimenticolia bacterium]